MAQRFTRELSQPQHIPAQRQVTPGADPGELVEAVGQVASTIFHEAQRQRFRSELTLDGDVDEFVRQELGPIPGDEEVAGMDDAELAEAENPLVRAVRSDIRRSKSAEAQGRISGSELRIRLEQKVREASQRHPWMADEYRRIAQQELGFDPTGETLGQAFRAEQERLSQGGDHFFDTTYGELLLDAAVWGGIPPAMYDQDPEEFERQALDLMERRGRKNRFENDRDLMRMGYEVDANRVLQDFRAAVPAYYKDAQQAMFGVLGDVMGEEIFDMSPNQRQEAFLQNRDAYSNAISEARESFELHLSETAAQSPDISLSDLRDAARPVYDMLSRYEDVLSADRMLRDVENLNEIHYQTARLGIMEQPGAARAMVMIDVLEGLDAQSLGLRVEVGGMMDTEIGNLFKGLGYDPRRNPGRDVLSVLEDSPEQIDRYWDFLQRGVEQGSNLSQEHRDQLVEIIHGAGNSLVARPDSVENRDIEQAMKLAAQPDFLDLLKDTEYGGDVRMQLKETSREWIRRMRDNLQEDFQDVMDIDVRVYGRPGRRLPLGEIVETELDGSGGISFQLKDGVSSVAGRRRVAQLRKVYGDKFEELVKSMSHLDGHTNYGQMAQELHNRLWGEAPE